MQLALQGFPNSQLLLDIKQDYQEVHQITDFLGNPRFPKSPTCDTANGGGETFPLGGQVPPLGWSSPGPTELEHPKTPVFRSHLWLALGFELWPSCSAQGCCRDGNCKVSCPGG